MTTTVLQRRPREEIGKMGEEIRRRKVDPSLAPSDIGKYVAISVESENFEIDADDYTAVARLREREPNADVWLIRAGWPAAVRCRTPR